MDKPLISVIIPSYNRGPILERAIQSVLIQEGPSFEIIVVDDGSTDDTREIVKHLFHQAGGIRPLPLKFVNQENKGVSAARNTGIEHAEGEWIAFLDSDDEWLPGKLEAQMKFFEQHQEYQICQTDEIWIRNNVRVNKMKKHEKKGGWIFEHCLPRCAVSPSAVMMRRSLFDEVGFFREDYPACEDYELWLRIAPRYPIGLVEKPYLKKYGGHEDQLSIKHEAMDRFRIQALSEVIHSGILNDDQKQSAQIVIDEKFRILELGSKNRNETKILNEVKAMLTKHEKNER